MSELAACSCTLQARLHQVENARSREMKAHGELVRTLELELESRHISEAALRLTAAKLRTDNCRLEAELCAANTKAHKLREQLDAQRKESIKREDELKEWRNETERQLQVVREKNEQLHVELSALRALFDRVEGENQLHLTTIEEIRLQARTQAAEIGKLAAQVTRKQQEVETVAGRNQLLLEDLARAREQEQSMRGRTQDLERDIDRVMVTRNRAFHWRRSRQDAWEHRLLARGAFLALKSIAVKAKADVAASTARSNQLTQERLRDCEQKLLKRCSESKEELRSIRQACASERTRMVSLREELCQTELPKLLKLLEKQQMAFETQRDCLEVQLTKQRECFDGERERLETLRQDEKNWAQAQLELQKRQQHAVLLTFSTTRRREFQRRTFSAWKELYLRAVVGQATHAAMVFQSLQSKMPAVHISSAADAQRIQSRAVPAAIRPVPMALQPLQLDRQKFGQCLLSPRKEAASPIDSMWRKWRRVDAGGVVRGQKPLSRLSSLLPSGEEGPQVGE